MSRAASRSTGRPALPLAVLLLAAGCLLQILAGYSHTEDLSGDAWGSDDAYISYRYARHLAEGEGLVFNPGERVEGFSNLLYVLLLAPAEALVGPDRLYAVSAGLNLLFAASALVLLARFARPRLGEAGARALAFLFALSPSLWVAVASGLETPLVLLLQIAAWILVERTLTPGPSPAPSLPTSPGEGKPAVIGFLCAVAAVSVLARADGFLTPLLAALFLVLRGRRRIALAVAAVTLATFGGLSLWRLSYYGWPLPNTYYAKMTGSLAFRLAAGWQQLLTIVVGAGLLVYVAAFAWAGIRGLRSLSLRRPDPLPGLGFAPVLAAGWLFYYLYVGGDVFYDRFLLILFPLGAYLILGFARETGSTRAPAALVVLLLVLQLVPVARDPRFRFNLHKYDRWVMLGRYLGREHPGALLAVDGAGKVPYFSNLRTIDMLGLADAHISHTEPQRRGYFWVGHTKSDLGYVLSRRPDLIANWLGEIWSLRAGPVPEPEILARAGYRLFYLVNTDRESKARNLVDVRRAGADEIRRLNSAGYYYGVFGRVAERRRASNSTSAAATVALRDSTGGSIGMVSRRPMRARRAAERPGPSAPTARTRVPAREAR